MRIKNKISKELLYKMYVIDKLSTYEIAEELHCSAEAIGYWLIKFNIERRTRSQALKGKRHSEEFKKNLSESRKGNKNPMYGKHLSEETKKKLSEKNKEKKLSFEHKKKISESHKGKRHTLKTREKISKTKRSLRNNNITLEYLLIRKRLEYRLWREAVFARDNFTCQKCGQKNIYLNAHHIKNYAQYPELRFAIDNGITLCKICHKAFHDLYGRRKNTKEQIQEFLEDLKKIIP